MGRYALGGIALLIVAVAVASANDTDTASKIDAVDKVFRNAGVVGTLVVESADGSKRFTYNPQRAQARFSPASTFKVPNTLIALDAGVVSSADSEFEWDGVERGMSAWNQNQTLASAFKVSCVWCYQDMARQVGSMTYTSELELIEYGNMQIGKQVDQFWLNNQLQISANEQIELLAKIQDYSIPYEREHIDVLRAIMLEGDARGYDLFAKTGWTGPELEVGWYVGFIEEENDTWIFAMNMQMTDASQAPLRRELSIRSLEAMGLLQFTH